MTSHRKLDHNILGMPSTHFSSALSSQSATLRPAEQGYVLVALIAMMTLMALFAMAAAPRIAQQAQREREKEAIFRGEEVADAIRLYYIAQLRNGRPQGDLALPTEMNQLVEGVPIVGRTRKLQILRASAARDPLSLKGEWQLVRPHSPEMLDFVRDVMVYAGNIRPSTSDPQLKAVEILMAPPVLGIGGLSSSGGASRSGLSASASGPFIGVTSSSDRDAILTYYGIERHDHWVFTPLFR